MMMDHSFMHGGGSDDDMNEIDYEKNKKQKLTQTQNMMMRNDNEHVKMMILDFSNSCSSSFGGNCENYLGDWNYY